MIHADKVHNITLESGFFTASNVFGVANLLIALAYVLLAFYFIRRIEFPPKPYRSIPAIVSIACASIFFIGCAHTHLDLFFWSEPWTTTPNLRGHWFSWWNVTSHIFQGLAGLGFWAGATFFLEIKIFDRKHFEQTVVIDMEEGGEDNV